jgi:hypothetical protein
LKQNKFDFTPYASKTTNSFPSFVKRFGLSPQLEAQMFTQWKSNNTQTTKIKDLGALIHM